MGGLPDTYSQVRQTLPKVTFSESPRRSVLEQRTFSLYPKIAS